MKKILSVFLCALLVFSFIGVNAADGDHVLTTTFSMDSDGILKANIAVIGTLTNSSGALAYLKFDNTIVEPVKASDKTTVVTSASNSNMADFADVLHGLTPDGKDIKDSSKITTSSIGLGITISSAGLYLNQENFELGNIYFKIKDDSVTFTNDNINDYFSYGTNFVTGTTTIANNNATVQCPAGGSDQFVIVGDFETEPTDVPVTGVSLDKETIELKMGATTSDELKATVAPETATDKSVTWESSDPETVTVAASQDDPSKATVTAVKEGSATITVTTTDGSFKDTCTVTVAPADPVTVPVEAVNIVQDSLSLKVDDPTTGTGILTAEITPNNATNQTVTWSVEDDTIATVSGDGLSATVTAVAEGSTTVTVTTADGSFKDTCTISVAAADPVTVPVTAVNIVEDSLSLKVSDPTTGTGTLTAEITPNNATNQTVTWSVEDDTIATVSGDGLSATVTAVAEGSTTVTVTTADGSFKDTCTISVAAADPVTVPVTAVNIVEDSLSLKVSDPTTGTGTLTAEITPNNATNQTVTWSVEDNTIATVSGDGLSATVTAVAEGSTTVTVTTADGSFKDTCTVTVAAADPVDVPVTAVKLNKTEATVVGGETVDLEATVEPENATNKTVIWSTSDDTVATVADGVVTTKEVEETKTVTITATSAANDSAKAECVITVNPKPAAGPEKAEIVVQQESGAQVSTNTIIGAAGDKVKLALIVDKGEANVTWSVSGDAATIDPATGELTIAATGDITVTATKAVTTADDITDGSVSANFSIYAADDQVVYLDAPVVELADTVTETTFDVTLKGQLTEAYPTKATISYEAAKLKATAVAEGSDTSVGTIDEATGTINLVNLKGTDDVVITFQVIDAAITAGDSTDLTLSGVEATTIDTPSNEVTVEWTETTPVVFVAEAPMAVEKLYTVDASATKAGGTSLYGLKITADEGYDIKVKDSADADKQAYWIASEEAYVVLVDVDYSLTGLTADKYTMTESEAVPSVVIGDVNVDNSVSAADALEVAKYMIGLNDDITDAEFIAANINLVYGTGAATPVGADDANLQDIGVIMDMATTVAP